ncbi:MAG: DUF4416 family protein [Candidatus Susulua stagnicola]|nr:DUF4416 family protein [Candidatus Susulua stagnicola]
MLDIHLPLPVKFISGFIYTTEKVYQNTKKYLEKKFGPIDFESRRIDFNFTTYYHPEMGTPLSRRFISFEKLRKPEQFVDIKLYCIKLEKKFALNLQRQINIDPGYINEAKLILTTTKDFAHRVYLGKGIYGEVTLTYLKDYFSEIPTTFPDYRTPEYKEIFFNIRKIYRQQIHTNK